MKIRISGENNDLFCDWGNMFYECYLSHYNICFTSMEQRGQFGDMFGMVNALFSGLAFAGVIITIRQQHIDLEYQRVTIKQTNDEMERQTKEFELQNKTLKRQQFDNTYFELLKMLQSIVDGLSLDVRYKDGDSTKR